MEVKPAISNSCKLSEVEFILGGDSQEFDQRFTYDAKHRLETISYPKIPNTYYKVNYNADNTIKNVVYTLEGILEYVFTYTYSASKLLTSVHVTDSAGAFLNLWTFTYNNQKQRLSWTTYNDVKGKKIIKQYHYTYDARGNVTEVKDKTGKTIRQYSYGDKLDPYALFDQNDLCFFIAHLRDQWTDPGEDFNEFSFAWRGFLPVNNTKNVITSDWSDEGFQQEYNNKDVVTNQNFFFTIKYAFAGCSF